MVAMSMVRCLRVVAAATAWHASWTATAWRSRSMYSTSSGGPSRFIRLARTMSFQVIVPARP